MIHPVGTEVIFRDIIGVVTDITFKWIEGGGSLTEYRIKDETGKSHKISWLYESELKGKEDVR